VRVYCVCILTFVSYFFLYLPACYSTCVLHIHMHMCNAYRCVCVCVYICLIYLCVSTCMLIDMCNNLYLCV
jgi:hypothetical protein